MFISMKSSNRPLCCGGPQLQSLSTIVVDEPQLPVIISGASNLDGL